MNKKVIQEWLAKVFNERTAQGQEGPWRGRVRGGMSVIAPLRTWPTGGATAIEAAAECRAR